MDSFDKRILSVLRDGRPRDFRQLLKDASFSHNTLRTHLANLERQGFIVKDKKPIKRRGRPVFVYSLPPKIRHKVALTITEPQTTVVSLTFQGIETPLQV
jgi:predicted ArsR family transcriptional regulator